MNRRESSKETATMNPSPTIAPASMPLRLRSARPVLALACALGAWLLLAASPAAAKVIHQSEGSFNGSDRPTFESFEGSLPSDAVDRSSGDVWVAEAKFFGFIGKADAVDKFNAKGEYAGVQITGEGTPQGEFAFGVGFFPGIAVDNTASGPRKGDLYVSDTEHGVVDRFSSSGTFECQITGKTPVSTEEIAHECNGAAGSLTPDGSIEPTGITVDSSGDVYVADQAHQAIDIFGPSGEYSQKQIKDPHLTSLGIIALDSAGNLYVTNFNEDVVKFDSSGQFVSVLREGEGITGVGVDPANNHVYVGIVREDAGGFKKGAIAEYEPSGALLDVFGSGSFQYFHVSFAGLAVGPTGKLYAAELLGNGEVHIYGPDAVVPDVTTQAASGVEEASATLHGHLDPDAAHGGGEITGCQFEYGPTTAYGETAPCSPAPPYTSPEDVSANITGLRPSSTYHFRLEAANANGIPSTSEDDTMTMKGPPTVDHEAAEGETASARFVARIDPWGYDTTCQLQYVTDASFKQSKWANATTLPCLPEDLGSGFGDVVAKVKVTGLARHTTYHYRFLAANQAGLTGYPDRTFETYGIDRYSIEEFKSSQLDQNKNFVSGEPEPHQAGAHPYELITTVELSNTTVLAEYLSPNTGSHPVETEYLNYTGVNTKDVRADLPPGLIGNPNATPKCNRYLVNSEECPGDTMVGRIEIWLDNSITSGGGSNTLNRPPDYDPGLYNLEPSGRYPAEFGAFIEGQVGAWIPFHVRTGSDYGVTAESVNITALATPEQIRVRVWGVPAAPAHDNDRSCVGLNGHKVSPCSSDQPPKPLLINPTSCTGSLTGTAAADSWEEPGRYVSTATELEGFTGCNQLQFKPSLEALPTTNVADSPSGLHVDLHVPQDLNGEGFEDPNGLATADLKDTKVTLPAGLIVNPASASGLAACSSAQIELHGPNAPQCPDAAKIGRVEVDTPLVDHVLPGTVYVAAPYDNPFDSLLAIYVVVDDPETGVIIKLAGHIETNPETGQLTTTFDESPQLPFEDFKLDFFGGSRGVAYRADVRHLREHVGVDAVVCARIGSARYVVEFFQDHLGARWRPVSCEGGRRAQQPELQRGHGNANGRLLLAVRAAREPR